ncbi:MAG TPA: DUF4465 domain-containing protein [Isosphaeraceae bacterium]|nr:DUF4465 domain-containing protein [Isosphaeraceae bacterium]
MIRHLAFALLLVGVTCSVSADLVSTFEDQGLGPNSYNNHPVSGSFLSGGNEFNNSYEYNAQYNFESWYGWAMSTKTNGTTSPIDTNDPASYLAYEYSSVTGSGSGGSNTYAVAYTLGPIVGANPPAANISVVNLASGTNPVSIDLTNTTYTYQIIEQGNAYANAFGSGDYYLLTITGYNGENGTGAQVGTPIEVYLADFRNSQQFVLSSWETVNLTALAGSRSLRFGLSSTDNSAFGIDTPAFFAADNLVTAVPEPTSALLSLTGLFLLASSRRFRYNHASIRGVEGRDA